MPPIDTVGSSSTTTENSSSHSKNGQMEKVAIDIIQQAIDLLDQLKDDQYTHLSKVMPGSTIGKHIRHVYDHFNLLYNAACQSDTANWILDYDIRSRNNPSETDRSIAVKNLNELQTRITENQHSISLSTPLTLLAIIDATDSDKYQFDSSFGRELFYSSIHAIHHYASVKAICIEQEIDVPEAFGMAPSTLQDAQSKK